MDILNCNKKDRFENILLDWFSEKVVVLNAGMSKIFTFEKSSLFLQQKWNSFSLMKLACRLLRNPHKIIFFLNEIYRTLAIAT